MHASVVSPHYADRVLKTELVALLAAGPPSLVFSLGSITGRIASEVPGVAIQCG